MLRRVGEEGQKEDSLPPIFRIANRIDLHLHLHSTPHLPTIIRNNKTSFSSLVDTVARLLPESMPTRSRQVLNHLFLLFPFPVPFFIALIGRTSDDSNASF
ncbi:hypothetical protein MLD38_012627 [Melastoma candidum]|uniref:Uncharacterized protein n=1 Tax=Melastoma candidum TaxID=119954 RepID=A0ACB9R7H7_9MYRT|nr:hypothetical protein MLD38_012627 [Melastoma candidum]